MGMTRMRVLAVTVGVVTVTMASGALASKAPCRPGPGAACAGADLAGAKLAKTNLTGAKLTRATLVGARLQGARLIRADLSRANLSRANLTGADLRGANLTRARLRGATLRRARLGRHTSGAARGAGIAAACRRICYGQLQGADFSGADMRDAIFVFATLPSADLTGARLGRATFVESDLSRAKLDGADLTNANFSRVVLRGASLAGARLTGARFGASVDLRGADLTGADLRGVDLSGVLVDPADLVGAKLDGAVLPENTVRTEITSPRAFSASLTQDGRTVTCTTATGCESLRARDTAETLTVTTSWAGFAFCPDGPVRLASADGGSTYTGTCTYTATQSLTIRLREARRITVRVHDLMGDPATIGRIAFEWRAPPTYGLVEAAHACTGVTACIGDYADGSTVRVVVTGSGPYLAPLTAACQGGTTVGESTMVSGPPWELTCLVGDDGNPLQLTTDRELVLTLS